MNPKEAAARIKINKLLEVAGWRFFDNEHGKANIVLEPNVKITKKDVDAFGEDFEQSTNGFVDFLLLDKKGFPLVVLEAKRESKEPLDAKEQARTYAKSQNCRFIILSNGNVHYLWDLELGNPTIISSFPTPDSIESFHEFKPNPAKLAAEVVNNDYVVLTQKPDFAADPRWADPEQQGAYLDDLGLKLLRDYQVKAVKALQESAAKGNARFLFEMATGTGKTLVSAAVIKLFLRTGNARRVLFLVDRLELEDQAFKSFVRYLKNDYTCVIYKENRGDWNKAEIVVTTVQSLSVNNRYKQLFSPTDFDLIISDEAHRSIGGNSRAVFEYFVSYKLGLTATPRDYLKNVDQENINQKDPREWERRQLLDTYTTFGCPSGEPTFRYSLLDGVQEGFLVNPIVVDARTNITTQLLSDEGYSIMVDSAEGDGEEEQTFFHRDFERKFFSQKTNEVFCSTFLEHALKDQISGEIGKSIIFCVSQPHASRITQILNVLAHKMWPGKYTSDFAIQVTSNIPNAQQFTINFSNNNLSGHTSFLQGYKSSKSRVCVTVGMMTTGYDCQDILNLCMMRPIFSPTDFVQMKGRGTRKFNFKFLKKQGSEIETVSVAKDRFKLFDFFANCEYFEHKYDYDQEIPVTIPGNGPGGTPGPVTLIEEVSITTPDPLKTLVEQAIGLQGMKVDRKLFEKFEETVKADPNVEAIYASGDVDAAEQYVKDEILNRPDEFFTLDKLRKAVNADRRLSIREMLDYVFGRITGFKSKNDLLEEEVGKFLSIHKPEDKDTAAIRNFLKAYITDAEIRSIVDSKQYGRLATNPKVTMADIKELNGWRDVIPEYVKDYVPLNQFA